jgi:hemolysin D
MKPEKKVVPFPGGAKQRDRDELAFLPAALEIVETPPSPIGRAIGATLVGLFVLALAWASCATSGSRTARTSMPAMC